MKRAIKLLLIFAFIIPMAGTAHANTRKNVRYITDYTKIPEITEEEITAIEKLKSERGVFTYGYLNETDSFIGDDGRLTGFTVYICDLLTDLFGIEFVPTYCDDFPNLKDSLSAGDIDFSGIFTPTPERAEDYKMSIPITGRTLKLYLLKSNEEAIHAEEDLSGRKVGFMSGSVTESEVREHYRGLDFITVSVGSFSEALTMLQTGEIDAFVVDRASDVRLESYDFITSKDFFKLIYSPVSITTSQVELEPVISVIDKYLEAGGIDIFFSMHKKGEYEYTKFKLYQSFTDEERAYLDDMAARNAKVDIGLQHDAYPVSFYNKNDGEYQGVAIDILAEIETLTGLRFEASTTSTDTPTHVILEKLKTGEISMMTQLLYSESRENDYIWSSVPYLQTKYAMLSKTEMPDLEIYQVLFERVGTVYKTAHEEMFETWFSGHENRIIYSTTDEAFDALDRGEIDLLMLSENMLLTQTSYRENPGFKINISFDGTLSSYFGFNKNETVLLSIVDKTMAYIDTGKIGNRWLNRVFDYSKKISDLRSLYISLFAIAIFFVLLFVLIMFSANRKLSGHLTRYATTLSAIYSSIPDTVYCKDTQGAFTSCNPSFENEIGLKEEDLIGKTYGEVVSSAKADIDSAYDETDRRVLREGTLEILTDTVTNEDGSVKYLEIIKAPLVQNGKIVGLLGIGRDITEREKQSAQLRVARECLQTVLDSLPMPIRIVDFESYEIVYANNSLAELLEYDSPEMLWGRSIFSILPEKLSDGTPSASRVEIIRNADEPCSIEIEYLTQTGKLIDTLVVVRRIEYHDRLSSIGIIKDLRAEKERAAALLEAAEREKEASRAKSMFLANMSHEIRTPMNGILGMTELLLAEQIEGRQLQYVKDIKNSAESLLGIINDILDLSKIGEGRLQITPVDIDLNAFMKNIVSMMRFSAQTKGLQFIDNINIKAPEYVRVDDLRLKQIVLNILSNAIKFTRKGHVKLSVKIEDGQINIVVSDTGIGISEDDMPAIFTAFEQVDKKKNRALIGTGLGLSISQSLTELMGGKIRAESVYGKGTSFFVTLPYEEGDESAAEAAEPGFKYVYAPAAKVLLVDDIQTNLTVGAGLLRLCGITADVAMSGAEAIELVKKNDYDIVFMDHMMPIMDGVEAMQHIRRLGGEYLELPIIALTANAVNDSKHLLLSSGMNDFISKPIDKGAMMNILRKWLPEERLETNGAYVPEEDALSYSETLLAATEIAGLDISMALNRIGGLQDVLEVSLRQVAFSLEEYLKRMDVCLSLDDLRGFAAEAHGLKGALSNIGAMRYSELAAELEISAKAENKAACLSKFAVFNDAITAFAKKLQALFSDTNESGRAEGHPSILKEKAEQAISMLESFEAEAALATLKELDGYTFGAETDAALKNVKSLVEAYNYEKSYSLLEALVLKLNI